MGKAIWFSWEEHRRTKELCKSLNIPLYVLTSRRNRILGHPKLIISSLYKLMLIKPDILFVQNPSIVLSLIGTLYKFVFKKKLVVDSHTSGIFPFDGKYTVLNLISKFIQKNTDFTIITNSYLEEEVERNNGNAYILQDKLPEMFVSEKKRLIGKTNVVYICSYGWDEPYLEVINAATMLENNTILYVTGNYKKVGDKLPGKLPENVILTGFIPEQAFVNLINAADILIDLTTREWCLLCGAYEAIALEKPFIVSRTKALMEYFTKGCIYTENNRVAIANAIKEAISKKEMLKAEVRNSKKDLEYEWNIKFNKLKDLIKVENNG